MITTHRALFMVVGCAKTQVTEQQTSLHEKIRRRDHIFVHDFAGRHEDVPADSALAGHAAVASAPQTPEQPALGREVGGEVAKALVAEIAAMGLPARRATTESALGVGDLVIRGYLLSVEEGSAVERVAIGMGKGEAELATAVEGYLMTDAGLRKIGSGSQVIAERLRLRFQEQGWIS